MLRWSVVRGCSKTNGLCGLTRDMGLCYQIITNLTIFGGRKLFLGVTIGGLKNNKDMKKVKDLKVGDIVYGLYDCSRLRLLKVKEIEGMKRYTEDTPFVRYRVVLVEMDDRMWSTFNLYSDKTEFDDYDITGLTYFLNKEEVKELLNDTLNEVNESFKLLEE